MSGLLDGKWCLIQYHRYSTMMRARSDSLDLEWRVQITNTGKLCKLYYACQKMKRQNNFYEHAQNYKILENSPLIYNGH